ncbi:MAG: C4-dicarboxylate transporter DctA [Proteobacteria bacterium]|nr:C4-dicarboxylate transporter DctA [Pseudomonadota bacterium]
MSATVPALATPRQAWWKALYAQVLIAIVVGGALGHFAPDLAVALKPLGDAFIKLVKLIIAPVIFLTVAAGIASMSSLARLGSTTAKAMGYFLVVSTLALVVGLVVANVVRPGEGMGVDPRTLDSAAVSGYVGKAEEQDLVSFLLAIIPDTFVGAFTGGQILPVLFVAILFGVSVAGLGESRNRVVEGLHSVSDVFFRMVNLLMRFAPIGAFGAFAFTIGKYGIGAIANLAALIATFYLTSALFIAVVLGVIARAAGFRLWDLLVYLKDELWLVLGTSSSESALPSLMRKLEQAGCSRSVVGLVVPTGYSFNLDGTNIYMTLAALFIAQATGVELSLGEQLLLLLVAMISSKGAAGVTGAGFITLAATLAVVPSVPVAGMALILGIDRFMSECRAITNFIGNAVATVVVARWEGALDETALTKALRPKD